MHKSNGKLSNRFRNTLMFLILYVLFYGGLLMLKAASKLRNFSFSMWLVLGLFVYLLKPLWFLTFCCADCIWILGNIANLFLSNHCEELACWPPTQVWVIEYMKILSHKEVEWVRMVKTWQVKEAVWLNIPKME